MDIIDVMLARAMTPQGQTETYVSMAQAAAAKAAKAETDAQAAIDVVANAAEDIAAAQEAAADLLASAQEALETAQEAQINTLDTEDVDDEIKKLDVSVNLVNGNNVNTYQVITTYPDNTLHTENATKMYKSTGSNEDGTMTQKAITNALATKADTSTVATKAYVDQKVANIPSSGSSGGISNLGSENSGKMVTIDENGNLIAGNITETELIDTLIRTGTYVAKSALGLEIDYTNKIVKRTQNAINLESGEDFNSYIMYGGRMRCNVANDGTINAFYGDPDYTEDGSNGQVMIYQPKFYYQRTPLVMDKMNHGNIIRKESLIISTQAQAGFKTAPIFVTPDGEVDYVLFSAYEGTVIDNKLASIANVKPTTNMTITEAETYATNRGAGWHITNLAAESANQMLEIIEFGSMNGQESLGRGISNINGDSSFNCASLTGSTTNLGNSSGRASSTINEQNGDTIEETMDGKVAISYRGLENPWGNIWHMIGGVTIYGNGSQQGGTPYICTNFNYNFNTITNNYEDVGFNLPSVYNWISAMAYGNEKYDWIFMPAECSSNANSLLPVGDGLWVVANVIGNRICAIGGNYNSQENNGPFYYAADRAASESARVNYGARLMFIPSNNNIYTFNIDKWYNKIGG